MAVAALHNIFRNGAADAIRSRRDQRRDLGAAACLISPLDSAGPFHREPGVPSTALLRPEDNAGVGGSDLEIGRRCRRYASLAGCLPEASGASPRGGAVNNEHT